ncbi:MAG: nitroreductase family protein [Desulfobacteraceae bacterium]|jgi:glutaredoxin-dependent peroxiredoxin
MPKQLLKEIDERRAYRALSEEPIAADTLARIMTAATYAPSCFNNQSWRFLVITEKEALLKVSEALTEANYWAKKAPAMVVVATKPGLDCQLSEGRDYALFDCGLATQNLLLQSEKEGVYAHPMAGFDPVVVKKAFDIPDDFIVITLVAMGQPGSDSHLIEKHLKAEKSPRTRNPESEVISYNKWGFDG